MTRCEEFYEKVKRDGNFCGMSDRTLRDVENYEKFMEEYPKLSGISASAALVFMREKDPKIKAKGIEEVGEQMKRSTFPTAQQVSKILENKRVAKDNRGGDHMGTQKEPLPKIVTVPASVQDLVDILEVDNNEPDGMPDMEELMESKTPLEDEEPTPEAPHTSVVKDMGTGEQAASPISNMEGREERQREDERENAELEEKNKQTRARDILTFEVTNAFKKAIRAGILPEYISEALEAALDNIFQPEVSQEPNPERDSLTTIMARGGVFK